MSNKHGDFIWYELQTSDADGAADFYGKVIGWTAKSAGQPGMDYRIFSAGEAGIGGLIGLSPDMVSGGAKPGWLAYLAVDDVDKSVASIAAAGGTVQMPAFDLDGIGRMAMVTDPQGVAFYVMRGASDLASHSFAGETPKIGHCAWNDLATTDQPAAMAFYTSQFGWVKDGEMDMGPFGKLEFLRHGSLIGALVTKMPAQPDPAWSHYFRVADIDIAIASVTSNGGQVRHGPQEVPGGDFVIKGTDPQGARFALVGKRL